MDFYDKSISFASGFSPDEGVMANAATDRLPPARSAAFKSGLYSDLKNLESSMNVEFDRYMANALARSIDISKSISQRKASHSHRGDNADSHSPNNATSSAECNLAGDDETSILDSLERVPCVADTAPPFDSLETSVHGLSDASIHSDREILGDIINYTSRDHLRQGQEHGNFDLPLLPNDSLVDDNYNVTPLINPTNTQPTTNRDINAIQSTAFKKTSNFASGHRERAISPGQYFGARSMPLESFGEQSLVKSLSRSLTRQNTNKEERRATYPLPQTDPLWESFKSLPQTLHHHHHIRPEHFAQWLHPQKQHIRPSSFPEGGSAHSLQSMEYDIRGGNSNHSNRHTRLGDTGDSKGSEYRPHDSDISIDAFDIRSNATRQNTADSHHSLEYGLRITPNPILLECRNTRHGIHWVKTHIQIENHASSSPCKFTLLSAERKIKFFPWRGILNQDDVAEITLHVRERATQSLSRRIDDLEGVEGDKIFLDTILVLTDANTNKYDVYASVLNEDPTATDSSQSFDNEDASKIDRQHSTQILHNSTLHGSNTAQRSDIPASPPTDEPPSTMEHHNVKCPVCRIEQSRNNGIMREAWPVN